MPTKEQAEMAFWTSTLIAKFRKRKVMTTPTQAQIVAAAKILEPYVFHVATTGNESTSENLARAALTAAAEVGPAMTLTYTRGTSISNPYLDPATIERCAQVAEGWNRREGDVLLIAAAIRKLKNKS